MSCVQIKNGFVCGFPPEYEFPFGGKIYHFEWHNYLGPVPLKKDGDPSKKTPKGFWDAIEVFQKLTEKEKEQFIV